MIKNKKIEVVVKKEKKDLISAKSEVAIAKELKYITYIILISFGISSFVYLYKSSRENGEYYSLLRGFNNHKSLGQKLYENKSMDDLLESDSTFIKKNEELFNKELNKLNIVLDSLYSESKLLNCYQEKEIGYNFQSTGIRIPDENLTIECIENKISQGNRLAFQLSLTIFIISSILLIVFRYLLKTINWVNKRT